MWEAIAASAGANIIGSMIQGDAIGDASAEQSASSARALGENARQFDISRADLAPYRTAGSAALTSLTRGMGLSRGPSVKVTDRVLSREEFDPEAYLAAYSDINQTGPHENAEWKADPYKHYILEGMTGGAYRPAFAYGATNTENAPLTRKFTMADFDADPVNKASFEFGLSEGEKAVKRMFGAKGMSRSGAAVKALTRFATDYAGSKAGESRARFLQDQDVVFNRNAAVAGIGQTATTTTANLGANYATNAGNILTAEGNARGAAAIARGNAMGGAIQNIGNTAMNMYTMDRILGPRTPTTAPSAPRAPAFTLDGAYENFA
jgi:hypothetical protein